MAVTKQRPSWSLHTVTCGNVATYVPETAAAYDATSLTGLMRARRRARRSHGDDFARADSQPIQVTIAGRRTQPGLHPRARRSTGRSNSTAMLLRNSDTETTRRLPPAPAPTPPG